MLYKLSSREYYSPEGSSNDKKVAESLSTRLQIDTFAQRRVSAMFRLCRGDDVVRNSIQMSLTVRYTMALLVARVAALLNCSYYKYSQI